MLCNSHQATYSRRLNFVQHFFFSFSSHPSSVCNCLASLKIINGLEIAVQVEKGSAASWCSVLKKLWAIHAPTNEQHNFAISLRLLRWESIVVGSSFLEFTQNGKKHTKRGCGILYREKKTNETQRKSIRKLRLTAMGASKRFSSLRYEKNLISV